LALGLQSAIWRTFGSIPGPLIFGAIFDVVCILWQDECGERGNCWVYDHDKLSYYVTALGIPCQIVSLALFFLAWVFYPKKKEDKEVFIKVPNVKNATLGEEETDQETLLKKTEF